MLVISKACLRYLTELVGLASRTNYGSFSFWILNLVVATFIWKKRVFRDLSWVKVKAHFLCFHQLQNVLKKWLGSTIMFPFCSGGPIIWMKTLVWFNYLRFHNGMQQFSLPRKANYFSVLKKRKEPPKSGKVVVLKPYKKEEPQLQMNAN